MRTVITALVVAATLLVSRPAGAHTIALTLSDSGSGEVSFTFGLDPFSMSSDFSSLFLDGRVVEPFVEGTADIVSGPLVDLIQYQVNGEARSLYRYGPGTVSLVAHWSVPGAPDVIGTFAATLLDLTVSVCEGCDPLFNASYGDVVATLGGGLFDRPFADLLRTSRRSSGGQFFFGPDGISGDPTSQVRSGGSHTGEAELEVFVPEPAMLTLAFAVGGAFLAGRRRRSRRPDRVNRPGGSPACA